MQMKYQDLNNAQNKRLREPQNQEDQTIRRLDRRSSAKNVLKMQQTTEGWRTSNSLIDCVGFTPISYVHSISA